MKNNLEQGVVYQSNPANEYTYFSIIQARVRARARTQTNAYTVCVLSSDVARSLLTCQLNMS